MATRKSVDIFIGFKADRTKFDESGQLVGKLRQEVEKLETAVSAGNQAFGAMEDIASRTAAQGAALWGGLFLSASRYVDKVGETEAASREWLKTTERMQNAQIELGRKSADALNPYRSALADIVEKASQLDPRIFRIGATAGGSLILVGTIGIFTAQVGRMVTATIDFTAAALKLAGVQASLAQSGAVAGVTVGSLALGAIIGQQIVQSGLLERAGLTDRNIFGVQTASQEDLSGYGLGDAAKTLAQVLVIAADIYKDIYRKIAEAFNGVIYIVDYTASKLKEGFDNLVKSIEKAALDLTLAIANIDILGQNVGSALGLDTEVLQQRRDRLDMTPEQRRDEAEAGIAEAQQQFEETGNQLWLVAVKRWQVALDEANADLEGGTTGAAARFRERQQAIDGFFGSLDQGLADVAGTFGLLEKASGDANEAGRKRALTLEQEEQALADFEQLQKDQIKEEEDFRKRQAQSLEDHHREVLQAEEDFHIQQQRATEDFQHSQDLAQKDHDRQRLQAEQDFAKSQQRAMEDFQSAEIDAAEEHAKERQQALDDAQEEELKRLAEFQRERERAEEDHEDRLRDAAAGLDAAAIFQEMQQYAKDKRRAEQDFDAQGAQSKKQLAEQLADQEKAYQEARQQRLEQYVEQKADAEKQFAEQQARGEEDYRLGVKRQQEEFARAQAQAELQFRESQRRSEEDFQRNRLRERTEFDESQQARQNAFRDQIRQLIQHNTEELEVREAHLRRVRAQLARFLVIPGVGPSTVGGRHYQFGGLSPGGMVKTEPNEGILDPPTTRSLAAAAGGFTMGHIRNYINNDNRSLGSMPPITVNVSEPAATAQQIARITRNTVEQLLKDFIGG